MVSLLVDLLVCAVLVGGAYLLFGSPSRPDNSNKKKKKKGKAKAKGTETPAIPVVGKGAVEDKPEWQRKNDTESKFKDSRIKNQPIVQQRKTDISRQHVDDEEFPPLSVSSAKPNVRKLPYPVATRLAEPRPETGVEDVIDPEVEPSRASTGTVRIVKAKSGTPLIVDETPEEIAENGRAASVNDEDDLWESVPVTNHKSRSPSLHTYIYCQKI